MRFNSLHTVKLAATTASSLPAWVTVGSRRSFFKRSVARWMFSEAMLITALRSHCRLFTRAPVRSALGAVSMLWFGARRDDPNTHDHYNIEQSMKQNKLPMRSWASSDRDVLIGGRHQLDQSCALDV